MRAPRPKTPNGLALVHRPRQPKVRHHREVIARPNPVDVVARARLAHRPAHGVRAARAPRPPRRRNVSELVSTRTTLERIELDTARRRGCRRARRRLWRRRRGLLPLVPHRAGRRCAEESPRAPPTAPPCPPPTPGWSSRPHPRRRLKNENRRHPARPRARRDPTTPAARCACSASRSCSRSSPRARVPPNRATSPA